MGLIPQVIGDMSDGPDALRLPSIRRELSPLYTTIGPQVLAYAFATARGIDVELPMGGNALATVYDAVHRDWMRHSALDPLTE
jgi:glucosamine 6-phosphate synthetase-like amidotransferase/phosphosugar isomerase protein